VLALGLVGIVLGTLSALAGCERTQQLPTVEITRPPDGATLPSKRVIFKVEGKLPKSAQDRTLRYRWDFGDGRTLETENVIAEHLYEDPGTYTVVVVAFDEQGNESAPASVVITVENARPQAELRAAPAQGETPLRVELEASGSYDSDGEIVSYTWDFGDGQIVVTGEPYAVHEYKEPGTYEVLLQVTDDDGDTAAASLTLTVRKPQRVVRERLWEVRVFITPEGRYVFEPAALLVQPGDTVRWVCAGGCPHTVTAYAAGVPADGPVWDSGPLEQGEIYELVIPPDAPEGTYPYACTLHGGLGHLGLLGVGRFTPLSEEFLAGVPSRVRAELQRLLREAQELYEGE
jgi:plastocyanin